MPSPNWPTSSRSETGAAPGCEDGFDPAAHLDELLRAWPESDAFSAHSFLRRFPSLTEQRSAVVAVAVEDYLRRRKAAHTVDLRSFAVGFGDVEDSIVRAAEVMEYFLDHPSVVEADDVEDWPAVGDRLLQFELLEELGGGRLSRVYVARDESVADRLVVLKLTLNSDREIRALGRLSHPGITPILSVAEEGSLGVTAVVMPFLSRVTLFDIVGLSATHGARGGLGLPIDLIDRLIDARNACAPSPLRTPPGDPVKRALTLCEWVAEIGATLADALEAAHRQGILHCDIKPSNIVLVDRSRPMLVDFNLCLGDDARRVAVGGTVPYMSQEQLCCLPLDARADVFSLAATLYHVLTGSPPFGGPEQPLSQALSARMTGQSRSGAQFHRLSEIDPAIAQVLIRALSFEPEGRFSTSAEFAEALRSCVARSARLQRFARRHRRTLLVGACACGLFIAGLGIWQANRDPAYLTATRAAIAAAAQGDFDESFAKANHAIEANSASPAGYVIRASALLRAGNVRSAHDDLKQAADLSRSGEAARLLQYVEYLLTRNEEDAIHSMNNALADGLSEAEARNNLGYCYLIREQFTGASTELEKAALKDPKLVSAWLNLAALDLRLAVQGKRRPDTHFIEEALKLDPFSQDVQRIAAEVYIQDVHKDGDTLETMKEHCSMAVRQGAPAAHLQASLQRVRERLGSWTLPVYEENADVAEHPVRTPRFVSPVDATKLAESLLASPGTTPSQGVAIHPANLAQ